MWRVERGATKRYNDTCRQVLLNYFRHALAMEVPPEAFEADYTIPSETNEKEQAADKNCTRQPGKL